MTEKIDIPQLDGPLLNYQKIKKVIEEKKPTKELRTLPIATSALGKVDERLEAAKFRLIH